MSPKKILIIHPRLCIRAIKQIEGLLSTKKFDITIMTYMKKYRSSIPKDVFNKVKIINFRFRNNFLKRFLSRLKFKSFVNKFDIVHCHNEPNYYIVDVIKILKNKIPIIYDIHDFTSMRSGKENLNEAYAYNNCDGIIHVNDDFIDYGNKKYGDKKCYTVLSTPSKRYSLEINKKKYSDKMNRPLHFVYQGGIYDKQFDLNRVNPKLITSYRNYLPYFTEILEEGHHLHLFTATAPNRLPSYMDLSKKYPKFHFHGRVDYKFLLKKMNKFDYGIAGFNFNDIKEKTAIKYLNYAMGNKLFDYIFSGIIPVVINARSMENFVQSNKCGYIKKDESWTKTITNSNIDLENFDNIINQYCIENQTNKIITLYNSLSR